MEVQVVYEIQIENTVLLFLDCSWHIKVLCMMVDWQEL